MTPIRRVVLIYPSARRFTGLLSTHRLPGLVIAHAGLTRIAQLLQRRGIDVRIYDEQVTPFSEEMVDGAGRARVGACAGARTGGPCPRSRRRSAVEHPGSHRLARVDGPGIGGGEA